MKVDSVVLYLHSTSNHNVLLCQMSAQSVVLYLHSTSNHNTLLALAWPLYVVLYLHSTSNHNYKSYYLWIKEVVLYLHSTSNHNSVMTRTNCLLLYYIFILHQTTTWLAYLFRFSRCIISSFYIKPQHKLAGYQWKAGCIISSFYIKPQP